MILWTRKLKQSIKEEKYSKNGLILFRRIHQPASDDPTTASAEIRGRGVDLGTARHFLVVARQGHLQRRPEGQGLLLRQQGDVGGGALEAEEPHGGTG